MGWCVTACDLHSSACAEGAVLSYEDRIAAGALDLGDDGPGDITESHGRGYLAPIRNEITPPKLK